MDTEIKYNDEGYGFKIDKDLTDYLTRDKPMYNGKIQKGFDKKFCVLNVFKEGEHISNLIFDTETQKPYAEIKLGEPGWCQLDMLRLSNSFDD